MSRHNIACDLRPGTSRVPQTKDLLLGGFERAAQQVNARRHAHTCTSTGLRPSCACVPNVSKSLPPRINWAHNRGTLDSLAKFKLE
eukprot:scaffold140516_cov36-Tisochrysis_lutea.AAC.4